MTPRHLAARLSVSTRENLLGPSDMDLQQLTELVEDRYPQGFCAYIAVLSKNFRWFGYEMRNENLDVGKFRWYLDTCLLDCPHCTLILMVFLGDWMRLVLLFALPGGEGEMKYSQYGKKGDWSLSDSWLTSLGLLSLSLFLAFRWVSNQNNWPPTWQVSVQLWRPLFRLLDYHNGRA